MAGELEGRVVVLTGAEGDIGRATARRLREEGALLVLTDLREQYDAVAVQADVTRAADCARIADAARDAFGGVDVLVNNHGAIVGAPFLETTEEQWDFVHGVVLKSIFLVSKAVVPLMQGRPGANVVNISSVGGLKALKYMSAYGAAKAGVLHLSKGMAIDLADDGIRVNAICPGVIDTQQPRQFVANLPDPEAAFAAFEPMHPIGRVGREPRLAARHRHGVGIRRGQAPGDRGVVDGHHRRQIGGCGVADGEGHRLAPHEHHGQHHQAQCHPVPGEGVERAPLQVAQQEVDDQQAHHR